MGSDTVPGCKNRIGFGIEFALITIELLIGSEVEVGDVVVDVGAYIGLYAIALAKRVGAEGKVFAFEPDPHNFEILVKQVRLNGVGDRIKLMPMAVGSENGIISFNIGKQSQSHVNPIDDKDGRLVDCICLSTFFFIDLNLDILKIDVEGYEELVLKGAKKLLQDGHRSPRSIYIEVHIYAWPELGTSWESLLEFMEECDYKVFRLDGKPVETITHWGEVVACKQKA